MKTKKKSNLLKLTSSILLILCFHFPTFSWELQARPVREHLIDSVLFIQIQCNYNINYEI